MSYFVPKKAVGARAAAFLIAALVLLNGCAPRTPYVRPTLPTPPAFKEIDGWKIAEPKDQTLREKWWEAFLDQQLNALEEQVEVSNQSLKVAQASLELARAVFRSSRASYYPTVAGGTSITSARQSENRPLP